MFRAFSLAFALLLPFAATAQDSPGFRFAAVSLEGGGHPAGDYASLTGEAKAVYPLSWGEIGVDLALSSSEAGARSLTTAGMLIHVTARPASWAAIGPYVWLGSQSEGGAAYALGIEAAIVTRSGWGGELWFGETRGGLLGDGNSYGTNKGLRISYSGKGRVSAFGELSKDTNNLTSGDQDFYRLAFGLETWLNLPSDRAVKLLVAAGQHHFDLLEERENWISIGFSIPLATSAKGAPGFSARRGVTHRLPMP